MDGVFKIVQLSDTHMVTGVRVCKNAIDTHGQPLPECEADSTTISPVEQILDVEKPDLMIPTGDQLHHDRLESHHAIFKLVAPLIERETPYSAVFGNFDDEGSNTLSRTAQMSILQDLPFSLCRPDPAQVDGVGNYYLQDFGPAPSELPFLTTYLLDSHGEVPSRVKSPDYDHITRGQIDWFTRTSQTLRTAREGIAHHDRYSHLSLTLMHNPLHEYATSDLVPVGGHRREPTEASSFNSRFYDVLADEGVVAVSCGHDHVKDCRLLPRRAQAQYKESGLDAEKSRLQGPWLCYAGIVGFGRYGSYDEKRYHRRARVWEVNAGTGGIKTWKRVEYGEVRVDEAVLVRRGAVVTPPDKLLARTAGIAEQAVS